MTITLSILMTFIAYLVGLTAAEESNFGRGMMSIILLIVVILIVVTIHRGGLS